MHRARVLLADDHQIFLAGLTKLLEHDFKIIGTATDGAALLNQAQALKPTLIVADVSMPELSGIEVTRLLHEWLPDVKIVLLTVHADPAIANDAFAAGATAYVLKQDAPEVLLKAMRDALRGKRRFPPSYVSTARAEPTTETQSTSDPHISLRQRQIVTSMAQGRAVKQIAAELHISPKTVEFHKYKLMRNLGVQNTAQLIAIAVRNGWILP
jgi:DNA-binding NarL/FixJ family response regulator